MYVVGGDGDRRRWLCRRLRGRRLIGDRDAKSDGRVPVGAVNGCRRVPPPPPSAVLVRRVREFVVRCRVSFAWSFAQPANARAPSCYRRFGYDDYLIIANQQPTSERRPAIGSIVCFRS